jgi:glycosyltransferase involved in cell wall biosynthesis
MIKPKVSISIATYDAQGKGLDFIKKNVNSFFQQTYNNLEMVISDHSVDYSIENYIYSINSEKIKYIRNENDRGLQVENINNAILNCTGEYIKLMNHDDYMEDSDTISCMVNLLNNETKWVISDCKVINLNSGNCTRHWDAKIPENIWDFLHGINYYGCPSVSLIPKDNLLDINVKYMADCELWYRLSIKYGNPAILKGYKINIGEGEHQLTSIFSKNFKEMLENDVDYCLNKYKKID